MRSVTAVTKIALQSQQTDKLFLVILEIDHADLGSPLRMVNDTQSIVSNGDTYLPVAFKFTPPIEEDGTIRNSSLTVDNIDRAIVTAIRSIDSPADVEASIIRFDDPDVIEAGPWSFKLRNVIYTVDKVRGDLIPDNPLRFYGSVLAYRNLEFPGLYG